MAMPAKPTSNRRRTTVTTLAILRPTSPANTKDVSEDFKNSDGHVKIFEPTDSNDAVFDFVEENAQRLQDECPTTPVDILVISIGGSGAGKGLTLMGFDEQNGVAQRLYEKQKGGIQVIELEAAQPRGTFTAKDLTSSESSPKKIVRQDGAPDLPGLIKTFRKCSVNKLRAVEARRTSGKAEHSRSSRTTVVMTSQIETTQGKARITVIDPPGRESPDAGTSGGTPISQQGTMINQMYLDLQTFIETIQKGKLIITGKKVSMFSALLPFHNFGNQILLCIIGVLYGSDFPTEGVQTRMVDMASRDLEVKGLIVRLKGTAKQEIDRMISQGHRQARSQAKNSRQVQSQAKNPPNEVCQLQPGKDDLSGMIIILVSEDYIPVNALQMTNAQAQLLMTSLGKQDVNQTVYKEDPSRAKPERH